MKIVCFWRCTTLELIFENQIKFSDYRHLLRIFCDRCLATFIAIIQFRNYGTENRRESSFKKILRPGANDRCRNMHNTFKKLLSIDYRVGVEQTRCKMFAQLTVAKYAIAKCRCVSKQV